MEVMVNLEPEALQKAETLAAERGLSIGKILGDALLGQHAPPLEHPDATLAVDEHSWPVFRSGHPATSEEIKAMIAEDEEWEITRGDPNHPWYSVQEAFEPGYPRVVKGPLGLPELQLRPPSIAEKEEG